MTEETKTALDVRIEKISASVQDLHEAIMDLATDRSDAAAARATPVIVGSLSNLLYFGLVSLAEIAHAQQVVAAIAAEDYAASKEEKPAVNSDARNYVGKSRRPFTTPE